MNNARPSAGLAGLADPIGPVDPVDPVQPIEAVDVDLLREGAPPVLSRLTLRVPPGAVVGLVGRNGAGKSTLMRCLVGLSVPDTGQCRVLGAPSLALPDAVRERLGYVGQTPDLLGWLNGADHLERFGRLYAGYDATRALALAGQLGVPMATRASQLSGGDQQKLSVLLALAHDPDVLILDEPVASLDPMSRRDFMRSLFQRRAPDQPPRTVLISSHLLTDLERVVSHVAFLREGRLQLMDEWDAMVEHVRLLDLPSAAGADAPRPPDDAVLHRRQAGDRVRWLVDVRRAPTLADAGQALGLDDLFEELNA